MTEKKKIPCRVCGKLFEPCSYCQSHSDTFRWRNFACSLDCAKKYINEALSYRERQKANLSVNPDIKNEVKTDDNVINEEVIPRKNKRKIMKDTELMGYKKIYNINILLIAHFFTRRNLILSKVYYLIL
jgi:hypothetical protein